MRRLPLLALLLFACAGPATSAPSVAPTDRAGVTPTPARSIDLACEPTRSRDASGVITVDGRHGILGETFTFGEDMNGTFWLVRRGAIAGDTAALHFVQIGGSAPATSVDYGVTAAQRATPWGDAAFQAGWKPISFSGSCWRLVVDGVPTGIVLALGR